MRNIITMAAVVLLAQVPLIAMAGDHSNKEMKDRGVADKAKQVVKTHPGKSVAVVVCGVAIAFFPPALLACSGAAAGGVTVDEVNKAGD